MIDRNRIFTYVTLVLLTIVLICHFVAMGYNHWKTHDHRTNPKKTVFIGLFHRCEYILVTTSNISNNNLICNENKYCFHSNNLCMDVFPKSTQLSTQSEVFSQRWCHNDTNSQLCTYSSEAKGIIATTIISACCYSLVLILISFHLLINEFEYQIHVFISMIAVVLLALGFVFMLATLITVGATLSYDLYQYHYNLNNRLHSLNSTLREKFKYNVTNQANREYETRTDWSIYLEIVALILSSFILIIQIFYLISTRRNRTGG